MRIKESWLAVFALAAVLLPVHPFTAMAKAEEIREGNQIFYRLEDGTLGNEHWEQIDGFWYYVGADGNVIKNNVIAAYDDNYYVFDKEGRMLRSQKYFINGLRYVIDESGVAKPMETEEELLLREYAAGVVAEITDESMTLEEKCDAIYNYLWEDFVFNQASETDLKTVDAAIKAFDVGRGNCYVLFAKAHYLYQAIGVKDMLVTGIQSGEGGPVKHWWSMVKVGDKYYHVDSTPFNGERSWNRLTTEQFLAVGRDDSTVGYVHHFDRGNYPKSY